jgi:hypothetical protein
MKTKKPSGQRIYYPLCGDWDCEDDDYDWDTVGPDEENYSAIKREHQIVTYHQPETERMSRLHAERVERNHGDPLWMKRT